METLLQDLRYGSRMLLKQPGFTAIAVIALALGIGANTAIFSVVNAVLLRPLPFAEPDRLMVVYESRIDRGGSRNSVSYPNFSDWRDQTLGLLVALWGCDSRGAGRKGFAFASWRILASLRDT